MQLTYTYSVNFYCSRKGVINRNISIIFLMLCIPLLSFAHTDHTAVSETVDCTIIKKTIRLGSRDTNPKGDVFALQTYLVQKHFLEVSPTGFFGKSTQKALLAFQAENNLDQVGIAGQLTRTKIKETSCRESLRKQAPLYLQN